MASGVISSQFSVTTRTAECADEVDFRRSLAVLRDAGFDGPLALIYDGPDADEWANLDRVWAIVTDVFAGDTVSA